MKNSFTKQNHRGFTLAEVLAAIGIIVILLALGVPGFLGLRKNIQITQYDDMARQIYIAAQNELTRLSVGGMDSETANKLSLGTSMGDTAPADYDKADGGEWSAVKDNYRYATDGNADSIAEILLPFGSVTDDVRSGHYVIEYNVDTNVIYGVFYSEDSFSYPGVDTGNFRTDKSVRKNQSPMVGYYGGSAVQRDKQNYCAAPVLTIDNGNELKLTITGAESGYTVTVTISDGTYTVTLDADADLEKTTDLNGTTYTLLMDSLEKGSQFKDIFSVTNDRYLTPGEDLDITVTFSTSDNSLLPSSATAQTNSLFATREADDAGDTVTLACARHLQNLDTSWSGLNDVQVKKARQTEDIDWSATGKIFKSITNANLAACDGGYQEIAGLNGSNGLFATTKEGMTLSAIRVVNPKICAESNSADPVGGLAGTAKSGTAVTDCGVYCYSVNSDGSIDFSAYTGCGITAAGATVGGLIGSAENCTITNSFAALPALSGKNGAGLIGSAADCTVSLSYAACDELDDDGSINYFLSGNNNTIKKCYAVGNLADTAAASFVSGSGNIVRQSYYAVSHTDYSGSEANDLTTTEYVTYNSSGAETTYTYEKFLTSAAADVGKSSEGEYDTFSDVTSPLTHPYREELNGRAYPYPGFYMLEHYGSWPTGDGTVTVTILMQSSDASDYRYNAGHVQVYELNDEGNREKLLFDNREVSDEKSSTYTGGTVYTGSYDNDGYKILDETAPYVTFEVTPGTRLEFVVNNGGENPDYTYVSMTGIDGTTITARQKTATLSGETTVKVLFRPSTFDLTANWPTVSKAVTAEDGTTTYQLEQITEKSYSVQYGTENVVLSPQSTAKKVSADSTVTIIPGNYPQGTTKDSDTLVVTYTAEGSEPVQLTEEDGKYTFKMPAANTTIDVHYEKNDNMVQVNVEYYVQGTDGVYPETAAKAEQRYYTVGKEVDGDLAEALSEASGKEAWENNGTVKVLDYSCFELFGQDTSDLLASTKEDTTVKNSYSLLKNEPVTLKIYIEREQYKLSLKVGEKIQSVSIIYTDGEGKERTESVSGEDKTVSTKLYYGQSVTASAVTEAGQTFTVWETDNTNFRQNSAQNYNFYMPYYDLTLTASAKRGYCLVTLELTEDGESWLASSDSRVADPVTLYLVDTRTEGDKIVKIPLENKTAYDNSYVAQALVPAVEDIGEGYNILIHYDSGEEYTYQNSDGTGAYQMTVRSAVTEKVEFYTVTYRVTEQGYTGTVPDGGTYPVNSTITVKGNTGLLKYENKLLIGWKDEDATNLSDIYSAGDGYTVTGKTYFFAQWEDADKVNVIYTYDDSIEDISGELPTSRKVDLDKQTTHTVEAGSLKRPGYTFAGWSCSYGEKCVYTDKNGKSGTAAADHVHEEGDVITLQKGTVLKLKGTWTLEKYTVTYYGKTKNVSKSGYTIDKTVTLLDYDAEKMGAIDSGEIFVGWAAQKGGAVRYSAGETITGLTANLKLYAIFADKRVRITYHYGTETAEQILAWGAPAILNPGKDGTWTVTAWNDDDSCTGQGYLCEEGTAHTVNAYSFAPESGFDETTGCYEIHLYANTGKVYNSNQYTWYESLYAAVVTGKTVAGAENKPDTDDTLIVYRDTEEPGRVEFTEDLYVIASGARKVKWTCDKTLLNNVSVSGEKGTNEFCGCMFVNDCAVTFGESSLSGVSGTLTFDAAAKSRVMALKGENCKFKMVDGVTLTNGLVKGSVEQNARISAISRQFMGGGVYAADGAYFNMAGGTISYCQATAGGGVYIVGQWNNNKWKDTKYAKNTYETSAKFSMGGMETPEYYASDKIYYQESLENVGTYEMVTGDVTVENYKDYYVTTGDPQIIYNTAKKNNNTDGGGGIVLLEVDSESLNLFSGAVSNNTAAGLNGGGIILDVCKNNQQLRLYEVEISHNSAANGGGIFQYQGTTFIYNGDILQNYASGSGGGIYVTCASSYPTAQREAGITPWKGNHEISEVLFYYGTIRRNEAKGSGGGIYLTAPDSTSAVSVKIEEGQILDNSADGGTTSNGGGIYIPASQTVVDETGADSCGEKYTVTVTIDGGEIRNNDAYHLGGGVYVNCSDGRSGILYLNGGYLSGNSVKMDGTGDRDSYECDICLAGAYKSGASVGSKYAAITTQTGDLANRLENDSDDPIYIVGYSSETTKGGKRVNGRQIVIYDGSATFNASDADCFAYTNGRDNFGTGDTTQVYVTPTVSGNAPNFTYKAPLILSTTQSGLCTVNFDYNYEGSDGDTDSNTVSKKSGEKILYSEVKDAAEREGYDLVGWTKTADAELEDYIIYYQDDAAYMSYSEANKHWMYKYEDDTWYKWDSTSKDWTTDFTSSEIDGISSDGKPAYTVTSAYSQTLYAQWQPYSVTYDLGDAPSSITMKDGSKAYGPTVELASPSKNTYTSNDVTYTFKGWSTKPGQTELSKEEDYENKELEDGTQITLKKSVTLYAVWQPETITITYEVNGGSTNDQGTHTEKVDYGTAATAWTGTYTSSGMILAGWATSPGSDKVEYAFGDTIAASKTKSDLSLYAVWKDIVTVKFDTDGGKDVAGIQSYAGGTITLPDAPTYDDDHVFKGWKYDGETYEEGESFTVPDNAKGSITLKAAWEESGESSTEGSNKSTEDSADTDEDTKAATDDSTASSEPTSEQSEEEEGE